MKLTGKNVVITGVSSGIGLETLRLLLEKGCRVVGCARQIEKVPLQSEDLFLTRCDVSDPAQLDALFGFALEKLGSIDVFISNAGYAYYEKLGEPDWAHIGAIFDTNVRAGIYCAEKMKALNGSRPYHFAITASAMGLLSLPGYSLYSATKAAVHGFADAYRFELEKDQHFTVLYPIATYTQFFKRAGGEDTPMPWPKQQAATVAKKLLRGIEHNKKRVFPSGVFTATRIADRFLPFLFRIYTGLMNRDYQNWLKKKEQ